MASDDVNGKALKQKRTSALTLCTKKRNALAALVESDEPPLNEIKTALDDHQRLLSAYRSAHEAFCDTITDEEQLLKEQASYETRDQEHSAFRRKMKGWIHRAEASLMDDLDSASTTSQGKKSSHASGKSSASTKSALVQEKARLAELLIEQETQSRMFDIERELASRKLELKIRKAKARQAVFEAEIKDTSYVQEVGETSTPRVANTSVSNAVIKTEGINACNSNQLPTVPKNDVIDTNTRDPLPKSNSYHASVLVSNTDDAHCINQRNKPNVIVKSNLNPTATSFQPDNNAHFDDSCFLHELDPFFVSKTPHVDKQSVNAPGELSNPDLISLDQNASLLDLPNDAAFVYDHTARDNPYVQNSRGPYREGMHYDSSTANPHYDRSVHDCMTDLARVFTLPQPEIPKFSGDPTEYDGFISAFENRIASRTTSDSDRLYFLHQYVCNEAKELVSGCLHMEASLGYKEARKMLEEEYGSAYAVSTAYFSRLMEWPTMKQEDGLALKKFALMMLRCKQAMRNIRSLSVLDHIPNLQAIVKKLPFSIQNKWRDRVGKMKTQHKLPDFAELAGFIQYEASVITDPVFGKEALSSNAKPMQDKKTASFAVRLSNDDDRRSNKESTCAFCHQQHDTDHCQKFSEISLKERKTFLKDKGLCFGCFGHNHLSRGCISKRTCTKCQKKHPTCLHDDDYSPALERKEETVMTALNAAESILHSVILVKVHQSGSSIAALTYAFYDSGSSGCFISEALKQQLKANGRTTNLKLTTMNGDLITETTAVDNIVVSDINGNNSINLPKCYTMDEIPVLRSQIPRASVLSQWTHLNDVISKMPHFRPEVPVGLLIGNNCPKAMQPLKVIPGNEEEPFAIMYPHGWTINGPIRLNDEGGNTTVICHRIIQQKIKPNEVITTNINPADIASRGLSADEITTSSWLQGPTFLSAPKNTWPDQPEVLQESETTQVTVAAVQESIYTVQGTQALIDHYSSWKRLKHAVAVYGKVAVILKEKKAGNTYKITADDLRRAETNILRFTQRQHFGDEMQHLQQKLDGSQGRVRASSSIRKLDPFMEDGLLKVGGRLRHASLEEAKHPILLPKSSHVTKLIIRDLHDSLAHVGRNHTLSALRENYWIVSGNSAVRNVIARCITCRKLRRMPSSQKMADLPLDRCSMTAPFNSTGVDFFGPFHMRQGRKTVKRYGVIFTCMASRSVHLEVAASLDTSSFINALRRFIARRGPIALLRCDNGTNFVGAERELREAVKEMDKDALAEKLQTENIEWSFNTPSASHHGGIWERLIRSVRSVLAGLMKDCGHVFDDEGLQTLICEVEAILNTRPITTVSSDPNDIEALTPNHLLTGKTKIVTPPPGCFQRHDLYMRRRWRRVQYAANLFWTRWRREYLLLHQPRQKWDTQHRNMSVGDIVIIMDDGEPRYRWSFGRLIDVHPDDKGLVRSVTVRTRTSELSRPVTKIILIVPVEEQEGSKSPVHS